MASKNRYPVRSPQRETNILSSRCDFGATGAPTLAESNPGFSIARTDTGDYTVTFDEQVAAVTFIGATKGDGAHTSTEYWQSVAQLSSNTVQLTYYAATSPADPGNGDWAYFTFHVRRV